jgi:Zn-dependent protease with chaperone function
MFSLASFGACAAIVDKKILTRITSYPLKMVSRGALCISSLLVCQLANLAYARSHEFEADSQSAIKLKAHAGGIKFLEDVEKYYSKYDYSTFLNRLIASHSSCKERIELLKNL